ncbi:hypothetical protein AS156_18145 [Bradyrhizobium macuxiense]|uniref:Uncharacterized protein n=1 Tax=Bradyrhizobium macuxiense TaxID=1755647 RepID=A0A109JGL0_9BRAD|nr:hypothetical protein AS156_18145 [Bradyrhizobium macuxiense]
MAFRAKNRWHRIAAALTDDDDDLPFPFLIARISVAAAIFFLVCWLYVTAKIAAIHLSRFVFAAADDATKADL